MFGMLSGGGFDDAPAPPTTVTIAAGAVSIAVPYRSQEDPDARRYRNDCGAVCIGMLMDWQGAAHIANDVLSAETALSQHDSGLACWQVAALGRKNGVNMQTTSTLTLDTVKAELDAGRPLIALISYAYIKARQNQADGAGHFVVVRGYDAEHVYINDPDFYGSRRADGDNLAVPIAEFEAALKYSPFRYSGVVIRG